MVPAFSLTAAQPGDGGTKTVGMFVYCEDILGQFILDLSLSLLGLFDLICVQRESLSQPRSSTVPSGQSGISFRSRMPPAALSVMLA